MKHNQSICTYWPSVCWVTICLLLFPFSTYAHTPWARFAQPQWDFIEEGNLDQAICGYKGWVVYGEDGPWQCDKDGILYPETVVSLDIEYPPPSIQNIQSVMSVFSKMASKDKSYLRRLASI